MKRFLVFVLLLFAGSNAYAEDFAYGNINMDNFWEKNGKEQEKINLICAKILNKNQIDKRIVAKYGKLDTVNASAGSITKQITVYRGLLPYIDNDDELAAVLSHEISHEMDAYSGPAVVMSSIFNSKSYEFKSDTRGIDYMVKAGYNPVAMMTLMSKAFPESFWDFGVLMSHPKTSHRLMEQYKYIYKKYPWALNSDMAKNINYQNWYFTAEKDVNAFQVKEKQRSLKRNSI